MQPVVRVGDIDSGHGCFPPRPSISGSPNVLVNGMPLHRVGDSWAIHTCQSSHPGTAITGNSTVLTNGMPTCAVGDAVNCGSVMVTGSANVFAGFNTSGGGSGGDGSDSPILIIDGVEVPVNQNSRENAAKLFEDPYVGTVLAIGDEFETVSQNFTQYPPVQTSPPPQITKPPKEEQTEPLPEKQTPPVVCSMFNPSPVDYGFQLSPNYALRDVTILPVFRHTLKAQRGLDEKEIVCNLQGLCENVLEALRIKYPGFRINSAFRTLQNGKSQHETGQAVDIQWPGISPDEYWQRALWVRENINFDQFILEHGNSVWFHLSFNRAGNRPKSSPRAVMTMYRGAYSSGLKRYY